MKKALEMILMASAIGLCAISCSEKPHGSVQGVATIGDRPAFPLRQKDIAGQNLHCARDLPGYTASSENDFTLLLNQWSERIRVETQRHLYRFTQNPGEFERSEGFFRMIMISVVLFEDYHVQYDPGRMLDVPGSSVSNDRFFADSRRVFLHGVLGPERIGTCSSLPVLYVAIGRQLGYPLKLVSTKGHLFVRWEGNGERFNVEVTGKGVNRFPDNYYRQWPFPITPEEERAEGYLKSMSPDEEHAAFLSIRAMCLRDNGRIVEAAQVFEAAAKLNPTCRSYRQMARRLHDHAANNEPGNQLTKKDL